MLATRALSDELNSKRGAFFLLVKADREVSIGDRSS